MNVHINFEFYPTVTLWRHWRVSLLLYLVCIFLLTSFFSMILQFSVLFCFVLIFQFRIFKHQNHHKYSLKYQMMTMNFILLWKWIFWATNFFFSFLAMTAAHLIKQCTKIIRWFNDYNTIQLLTIFKPNCKLVFVVLRFFFLLCISINTNIHSISVFKNIKHVSISNW